MPLVVLGDIMCCKIAAKLRYERSRIDVQKMCIFLCGVFCGKTVALKGNM